MVLLSNMAFIDELKISMKAGDGGNGVERWNHEKGKEYSGPGGGDAGHGGDVFFRATRDVGILAKYRHQKEFEAQRGGDGGSNSLHGANGEDFVLDIPIGSIVKNLDTSEEFSLETEGQKELVLKGGVGGYGNEHFKSSVNTTPKEFTLGKAGEEGRFFIELQLFGDVGLVGLPNAGKSSLLNALTRADAKVGSYQFTTLDPNLGAFYGFIIADIPGIIEGAHEGKGLGVKFLKHIKRTKMLVHLVSFENPDMLGTYKTIRNELGEYDKSLLEKDEVILLTKTDVVEDLKIIKAKIKEFEKACPKSKGKIFAVSLYDDASVKEFGDELVKILRK